MKIPYVIDNQTHRLADILNGLLAEHRDHSLDVATAYFTVGGVGLIRDGLSGLGTLRLLLGAEPATGEQIGLRPDAGNVKGLIRRDLEALPFDERTLRLVEDLIAYLRRDSVLVRLHDRGFLHAKCWLFYSDRPGQQTLFDRFRPIVAIVGSSNFTAPGLTSNRELNLAHKVLLDPAEVDDPEAVYAVSWLTDVRPSERITPENRQLLKSEVGARAIIDLEAWYERQWADGRDFKEDLIGLLDASKFGQTEYTPYQVYMKALYEYFQDDLAGEAPGPTRSAVELAEFQEDAVKKARKILARYDGVMIADSVGLGKTWIGKKLLEDFAYHLRQKALVVCPASLREMWERELAEATISATVLSQEELGREEFDPAPWGDADVVLIDESHNFRNRNAQRYGNVERLLGANGGRGRDGSRKKVLLLTATPINNDLFDLHWNPTRMVQRAGRIDRIGTDFDALYLYNMFPDAGLERLLGLVESLSRKIADIDRAGFLDASVLGETVHPQNFNTLRRIRDEDGSVIEEEEQFTELASNEFLVQQLRVMLDAGGQEMLESLPDGIHSGLARANAKGAFFYFQAPSHEGRNHHFWKYYDLKEQRVIDNRYLVANLIVCERDTPRVVDPDLFGSVFDLQEKVIEDILQSVQEQRALEVAPRSVDPIQQTVATALQGYLNHPDVERKRAVEAIRFLNQPMLAVQVRDLRQAYKDFQRKGDVKTLLETVEGLREKFGGKEAVGQRKDTVTARPLGREDLRLICFDLVTGG